ALYVKGYDLDWKVLFPDRKFQRISLPTYPFARERYWVTEIDTKSDCGTKATSIITASIHPLLHQNTSDFYQQRFTSNFTGQEFFLADHMVKGQRVLPGVAYLEMVRVAVEQSMGALDEEQIRILLKNIVWIQPMIVEEQSVKLHMGLSLEDTGEIAFEIYTESETAAGVESVVHSRGSAMLSPAVEALTLDLSALQAQCSQNTLSSSQCYETFRMIGLEYGPGHQGIEEIYVGSDQALAKLSLPSSVSDTKEQFVLHPSLMDAAVQASLILIMRTDDTSDKATFGPILPFALQELEILGNCTDTMWTLIRYSDGSKARDKVQKLDIDMCDEQGRICVRMKGFSTRGLEGEVDTVGSSITTGTLM
ncbi:MAG: polyketide synthase dehydratase domain-containing protein, partial [Bacillus sp. (in: firmicutes)]